MGMVSVQKFPDFCTFWPRVTLTEEELVSKLRGTISNLIYALYLSENMFLKD